MPQIAGSASHQIEWEAIGVANKCMDFIVTCKPAEAVAVAESALTSRRFKLTAVDERTVDAERGSQRLNRIFADAAMYMKVGIQTFDGGEGRSILRIEKLSEGRTSGGVGTTRTKLTFRNVCRELEDHFTSTGELLSVSEGWEESDRSTKL